MASDRCVVGVSFKTVGYESPVYTHSVEVNIENDDSQIHTDDLQNTCPVTVTNVEIKKAGHSDSGEHVAVSRDNQPNTTNREEINLDAQTSNDDIENCVPIDSNTDTSFDTKNGIENRAFQGEVQHANCSSHKDKLDGKTTIQSHENNTEENTHCSNNNQETAETEHCSRDDEANTRNTSVTENILSLNNVKYTVKVWKGKWWTGACLKPRNEVVVLNNINMTMESGKVTALMGNSGSGKTSLLDVIARRAAGTVEGKIRLNGKSLKEDLFREKGGYVIQADHLLPNLTVHETLTYIAHMKFLKKETRANIEKRVEKVIDDLGLRGVRDSIIGGTILRGISGGELRRVSVATQMLQDPTLLLLDEPTTGLDSFTARRLLQSLSKLAKERNKMVIMSIHQPSSELFPLFDDIALLTQGETVYYGPRSSIVDYFSDMGYPCPTYANPLDVFIDVVSIDRRSELLEKASIDRVDRLKEEYVKSQLYKDVSRRQESLAFDEDNMSGDKYDSIATRAKRAVHQGVVLYKRMNVNLVRSRADFVVRFLSLICYAFFVWLFVWRLGSTLDTIQDRVGVFYQTISAPPMVGVLNCVALFPSMRALYYREAGDGLYGAATFLTTYYFHIIPFHIVSSMGYSVWIYWGVGMYPDAGRFFTFYGLVVLLQYVGELQTMLCFALLSTPQLVTSINVLIVNVCLLISSGFVRTVAAMAVPLQWLAYVSYMKYGSEILVANEMHQLQFDCRANSTVPCEFLTGDLFINIYYRDAVDNLSNNFGIIVAIISAMWFTNIVVFKLRGVKYFH